MAEETPAADSREQRVNAVLAAYLEAERECRAPDRDDLLACHPDLADELRSFFADRDRLGQFGAPPGPIVPDPAETVALGTGAAAATVRMSGAEFGLNPEGANCRRGAGPTAAVVLRRGVKWRGPGLVVPCRVAARP
jgi:hypothetical protein